MRYPIMDDWVVEELGPSLAMPPLYVLRAATRCPKCGQARVIRSRFIFSQVIRSRFIFSGKNDELTPDFADKNDELTPDFADTGFRRISTPLPNRWALIHSFGVRATPPTPARPLTSMYRVTCPP